MIVKTEITIRGSRAEIWSVITDIRNAAHIIRGIEKTEILHAPVSGITGLKWLETRLYFGKPSTIEKWITEVVDGTRCISRAEMDGFVFETIFEIDDTANGCLLKSCHQTIPLGMKAKIKSLPMFLFKGMLKKAIIQDLMDIRDAVEKKQT